MKHPLCSRRITACLLSGIALLFLCTGLIYHGFWDEGPLPGFFPIIMSALMLILSLAVLFRSYKDEKPVVYERDELLFIACTLGIIVLSLIVGLLPATALFIVLWLRFFEKSGWKEIMIVCACAMALAIGVFSIWLDVDFPLGLFDYFAY